jgi:ABC-type sugar transport system permease subunit
MNNTKRLGLPKKRGPAERGFSRGPGLSLQGRNAWAGMLFVAPFTIGFVAFMAVPLFQSLFMVFTQVTLDPVAHRFYMAFTGLENLKRVFFVDPEFNRLLTEELLRMLLIVPAVLIFSLFAALLLNQDFKGRGVVRVFFFLPVILSSGILINLEMNNALMNGMAELVRKQNAAKTSVTGILEDVLIANWNLIPMS